MGEERPINPVIDEAKGMCLMAERHRLTGQGDCLLARHALEPQLEHGNAALE
jgi:hypothetical protein